jgi:sigma-B regulation protein RsbU (phosphoserine phosphatase)
LPTSYATLVCGRTSASGEIDVCNAGHPPPLVVRAAGVSRVEATGLPIGLFCSDRFSSQIVGLDPGDTILLYTDGVIEAENPSGEHYGIDRLSALAASAATERPQALVAACLRDVARFCGTGRPTDDLTIMAVQRR